MKTVILILGVTLMVTAGCVSKSRAEARTREAYLLGQKQGALQAAAVRRSVVRFIGPVQNPEIAWTEGMTLAQAIAAAGYSDARDPQSIVINRQNERIPFEPRDLLAGKDFELQPGDLIEIHP
jgi:hypothetical protein